MCRYRKDSLRHDLLVQFCALLFALVAVLDISADQEEPWLDDPGALAAIAAQNELLRTFADEEFERLSHPYEVPDTMYASTPTSPPIANSLTCPVRVEQSDRRVIAHSARQPDLRSSARESSNLTPKTRSDWRGSELDSSRWGPTQHSENELSVGRSSNSSISIGHPRFQENEYFDDFAHLDLEPLHVPLVLSGADQEFVSQVRLSNHSAFGGNVHIIAIDDIGQRRDPIRVAIDANDSVLLSISDLELGNPDLGISNGIGVGVGNWRLEVTTNLALKVSTFVQSSDGLVVSMHDTVKREDSGHHVSTFFSSTDSNRLSQLRLINPGKTLAHITIRSKTENGLPNGTVSLQLLPGVSTLLGADEMELGSIAVQGTLDTYTGVRQLHIASDVPIHVMNLVKSSSGHLTNVSTELDIGKEFDGVISMLTSLSESNYRKSLIRFINRSRESGVVQLDVSDEGTYSYPTLEFEIGSSAIVQLSASDIESGNTSLGIHSGFGYGVGDWRLKIESELDLGIAAFTYSEDGFVSSVHDFESTGSFFQSVELLDGTSSPWDNRLVLTNASDQVASVEVVGFSKAGEIVSSVLRFQIEPREVRQLTRFDLVAENSGSPNAIDYEIVDWRLQISSDQPLMVHDIVEGLDGRISTLSPTPLVLTEADVALNTSTEESAAAFFTQNIYAQIVQSRCINCHVDEGRAAQTRLVFVNTGTPDDDEAANLQVFRDFLGTVVDGKQRILDKIQGIAHGGGTQFLSNTQEFKDMSTFLGLLESESQETEEPVLTADTLLQHVALESDRKTLWRAALILAGRIPTETEYTMLDSDDGLRSAVRGLMEGHAFHEFLIRSANDQLLTDRDKRILDEYGLYVDYTNKYYELYQEAVESGPRRNNVGDYRKFDSWRERTQYGVRREGLELIAHVVKNDLPYTEILTADYVMANPYTSQSYGATPDVDDDANPFDFQISDIHSYYRRCAGRSVTRTDPPRVTNPGSCDTDLPFAGILSNKTFLLRYPTTATNRNRARSRWTYYHFLDVDIENSASRTTDPVALADTNNPTMKNSACTVCHAVLDPVAGAFQDYGEEGDYWDEPKGYDSLDYNYKISLTLPRLDVSAKTFQDRELVSVTERLDAGTTQVQLAVVFDNWNNWSDIGIDYLSLKSHADEEIQRYEIEDLEHVANDRCGNDLVDQDSGNAYAYMLRGSVLNRNKCAVVVDVSVAEEGTYKLEANVWITAQSENVDGAAQFVIAPEAFYRDRDTWYRDMLNPGFVNESAPKDLSSLQWLAHQIVADDRFSIGAVKFWWPAIMGEDVPDLPTNRYLPDYDNILVGITSQHSLVDQLAKGFREGFERGDAFNLRDLLTEMIVSPWFRGKATLEAAGNGYAAAFANIGARRLLTPEELSRKTASLTGFQWGRVHDESRWRWVEDYQTNELDAEYRYRLLYGGIDSNGIIDRARDMTAVMAGVAKSHAVEVSCPVIMRELYLLNDESRYLFSGLDKWTSPSFEFGSKFEITANSSEEIQTVSISGSLPMGDGHLVVAFLNDFYQASDGADRNIRLETIRIKNSEGEVQRILNLEEDDLRFLTAAQCNDNTDGLISFYCEGTVEIPISVTSTDTYTVEADIWADHGGDEQPLFFMAANSTSENSAGSRAIKSKLVDLHGKLLGEELNEESTEIQERYELLVDSWKRNKSRGATFNSGRNCNHGSDYRFLEGVVEEPVREIFEEKRGTYYVRNNQAWNELNQTIDWSDPTGIASTWVVVLTSFLMDFDYLHL